MKYIVLTFDDGRSDNYLHAKRIMERYGLTGTVYVTTGFIDGTWKGSSVLKSPSRPLCIEEILRLKNSGWEIGLHGDKHLTCVEDMAVSMEKLISWGIDNPAWGFSVPNSKVEEKRISEILNSPHGARIGYVRRGRKCDTSKFVNRLLYGIYSVTGTRWAYRRFNAQNVFCLSEADSSYIPSVVVKGNDRPEMIVDFVRSLPDQSVVVFMLHSILPNADPLCGKDPWSWEESKFETLCAGIYDMIRSGTAVSIPLMDIMRIASTRVVGKCNELKTK